MENNVITEIEETVGTSPEPVKKSGDSEAKFILPKSFDVRTGPYIKRSERAGAIMLDVVIALLPAFIWGCIAFGVKALTLALISVGVALASEFVSNAVMKQRGILFDMSAVITGLLVAMCLPVNAPVWMPIVGSFFAVVVVKQCFGGLGKNIFNPAAAAIVLLSAGERALSYYFSTAPGAFSNAEATLPLGALKNGVLPSDSILDLVIGNCAGAIGEVSSILLIAGGVYLILRRVISWHIPVAFIGTVAVVTLVFPSYNGVAAEFMAYEIFSGALILAAFFMATDYTTSPVTNSGKIIFGIGCGLITVLIRYFGSNAEGVMYAILIMNLVTPIIDKLTLPKKLKK